MRYVPPEFEFLSRNFVSQLQNVLVVANDLAARGAIMGTNILDLSGRVGLITGAGQGVGRAVALRFAENNAAGVVVNDFNLARAEAVAAGGEEIGAQGPAAQGDVTHFASVG